MHRTASILLLAAVVQLRAPAGITIEAESLAGSAQATHGKVMPQDMQPFGAGWSGGSQLFWGGAELGAELNLTFTTGAAGRYEIFVHFTRAPDFALVRVSFDGAPFVSFNGYAPTVSRDRALVAMRDITPGKHELLLKVTSKDGSSKGLNVGIDRIELAPVGAAMTVEGKTATVPVLTVPARKVPPPRPTAGTVEPLSASERNTIVQQAAARAVQEVPGQPLRLTASQPRILNKASVYLIAGSFSPAETTDGAIFLYENSKMGLSYRQVAPNQPHLLDCGVRLNKAGEIKLSADLFGNTTTMQLHKVSLPQGEQRLVVVLVPEDTHMWVVVEHAGTDFLVRYCELTFFK